VYGSGRGGGGSMVCGLGGVVWCVVVKEVAVWCVMMWRWCGVWWCSM
jgi:hypothetical protein